MSAPGTVPGGPDLRVQKNVTYFLLGIFSVMMLAFIAGLVVLMLWVAGKMGIAAPVGLPDWLAVAVAWIEGMLGSQMGTLTGSVKDAIGFWINSSFGSKTKDRPPAQTVPG